MIECVSRENQNECLKALKDDKADLTVLEGGSVSQATKDYNAKPLMAESYGQGSTKLGERAAVAVVKKSSPLSSLGRVVLCLC